jgi:hypothetical protein
VFFHGKYISCVALTWRLEHLLIEASKSTLDQPTTLDSSPHDPENERIHEQTDEENASDEPDDDPGGMKVISVQVFHVLIAQNIFAVGL